MGSKTPQTISHNHTKNNDSVRYRETTAISIGTNGSPKSYGDASNNLESNRAVNTGLNVFRGNVKSTYWKTKLCIKFETTGHCPFGDDCHFAHGQAGTTTNFPF